jgi:transcriptional regulator with XRE-family HTH domain
MDKNEQLMQIRMKKLAILIRDLRRVFRKGPDEIAEVMGVSLEEFHSIEQGKTAPTLPQLEAVACFLDIPASYFWTKNVMPEEEVFMDAKARKTLRKIRNRYLGVRLRQLRNRIPLSEDALAEKTSLTTDMIRKYESGKVSIPIPVLENLLRGLGSGVEDVFDQSGPIGAWRNKRQNVSSFLNLSLQHQQFITKPVNKPYIDLAMRLSEFSVEKLRSIAEGLLEITY